jgi:hypothetical protein
VFSIRDAWNQLVAGKFPNLLADRLASLLIHFDGDFSDSSANPLTVTPYGGAAIDSSVLKFGSGSMSLDGTGYLQIQPSPDLEPLGEDFTIEFWWYPASEDRQWFFHSDTDLWLGIDYMNGSMGMWASSGGWGWDLIESDSDYGRGSIVVPQGEWSHIAYVRSGNYWSLYVNGVLDKTIEASGSVVDKSSESKYIGSWAGGSDAGAPRVVGSIDEFRYVTGVAVYTGNFTPPTSPLSVIATPLG